RRRRAECRQRCHTSTSLRPRTISKAWRHWNPILHGCDFMKKATDILGIISSRRAAGEPFVLATVVRTVAATAAKAGAKAVILPGGTFSGGGSGGVGPGAAFTKRPRGGLADGRPRLVSVEPPDELDKHGNKAGEEKGGVRFAENMCPNQGTMDIFVEP